MKKILLYLFFLVFVCNNNAQDWKSSRPAWVTPAAFDYSQKINVKEITEGYYYFLADRQVDIENQTFYNHHAVKILNSDGVNSESKLYLNYNPAYEKLKVHSVIIHRDNRIIDKLADAHYSILQREEELENNLIGGRKTASLILTDVRVGDIIEYDYSIIGENPIFNNRFYTSFYLNGYYDALVKYFKIRFATGKKIYVNYINDSITPAEQLKNGKTELVWELKNVKGLKVDKAVPQSLEAYNLVEVSDYSSWQEVALWGTGLFKKQTEEIKILTHFINDLKKQEEKGTQIINALRFVQDSIRYFGIEIGQNSHQPKPIGKIFSERFGDCKDKTYLFCYLLDQLGIKAYPVLVNSQLREGVIKTVPSPLQFDHVVTLIDLNGKPLFFDPTITYQSGTIYQNFFPDYGYGLVLSDTSRYLTRLPVQGTFKTTIVETFNLKNMSGLCELHVKTDFWGNEADYTREWVSTSAEDEIKRKYIEFYEKSFTAIDTLPVIEYFDDPENIHYEIQEAYGFQNIWQATEKDGIRKIYFLAHTISDELNKINLEEKTRRYPLKLNYPETKLHKIEINLPEDWTITAGGETIENDFIAFKSSYSYFNRKVVIIYTLDIKKPEVPPEKYVRFKKDIEKIRENIAYELWHNTKSSPKASSGGYSGIALTITVFFSLLCLMVFLYCLRFFKPLENNFVVPVEISSWLVLPMLGLGARLITVLSQLFFGDYLKSSYWKQYTEETSSSYLAGFDVYISFQICYLVFIFFVSLFILIHYVKKNRMVPNMMIFYYLFILIFQSFIHVLSFKYGFTYSYLSLASSISFNLIIAGIWIPYFIFSKRVKETFVT